ncbi:hypothetical protein GN956_G9567 [Arapaima gigas]
MRAASESDSLKSNWPWQHRLLLKSTATLGTTVQYPRTIKAHAKMWHRRIGEPVSHSSWRKTELCLCRSASTFSGTKESDSQVH